MTVTSHSMVARRYAQALFELADGPALDSAADDMTAMRAMLADSAELRVFVRNPVVSRADRLKAVEAIAAQAGFGDLTKRFLGVVVENNRLADLDGIAAAFLHEVSSRRGLRDVEITVARPLDEGRRARIEEVLNRALAAKTIMSVRVDPAILGGIVIRVESQLIDASLKTKLDRLGRILKTAA